MIIKAKRFYDDHGILVRKYSTGIMVYTIRREKTLKNKWEWVICFGDQRLIWSETFKTAKREMLKIAEEYVYTSNCPMLGVGE